MSPLVESAPSPSNRAPLASGRRTLSELIEALPHAEVRGPGDRVVTAVTYDSTLARADALFFAVPGTRTDGHGFAADAASRGASSVVVERWLPLGEGVTQVRVPSVRAAMGPVAAAFYGQPADRLVLIGVTGTNGKTTTTYILEEVFRAAGMRPGVLGPAGMRVDGRPAPLAHTTPEAPDLHEVLAGMVEGGVDAVAMEVSSHGLHQDRVGGARFACAVFTNLSQDHLDYHGTLDEYFEAKARLFTPSMSDRAAVNHDSPHGRMLEDSGLPTLTYGIEDGADVHATGVQLLPDGLRFRVGELEVRSSLRGHYNVQNCLAALTAARQVGIDDRAAVAGIGAVRGVPGRMEPVDAGQPFQVLVDYAHTPDSLENVLRAARGLGGGRLIVVFGCGGDRDRGKRPLMGEAATTLADATIVTSDNPRSEKPEAIMAEIEPGAKRGGGAYTLQPDRRAAIREALVQAAPGDVVVVAGKGHETGQEFSDRTIPFDDRIVAAEILEELR